jgi:DNA-3-methyladenine glycosylase II
MVQTTFFLTPTPPFRLDLTVWALRRRAHNQIDLWDGRAYQRAILLGDEPVGVEVIQNGRPDAPQLHVSVTHAAGTPRVEAAVTDVLRRLLGIEIDLAGFYQFAESDQHLGPLASRFRGFKPPRYASLFEASLNGIACQQVTLNLGIQMLNRLAATYGVTVTGHTPPLYILPSPERLAEQTPEALRSLGFSGQKARTMLDLASAQLEDRLALDHLLALDNESAVSFLREFRGIGRWTAEYVLLRGLGRLDVFPSGDSGARKGLKRWLGLDDTLDYEGVSRTLGRWRPYAGLIYLHLLLKGLADAEQFDPAPPK